MGRLPEGAFRDPRFTDVLLPAAVYVNSWQGDLIPRLMRLFPYPALELPALAPGMLAHRVADDPPCGSRRLAKAIALIGIAELVSKRTGVMER
jgi:hypothetical protein